MGYSTLILVWVLYRLCQGIDLIQVHVSLQMIRQIVERRFNFRIILHGAASTQFFQKLRPEPVRGKQPVKVGPAHPPI